MHIRHGHPPHPSSSYSKWSFEMSKLRLNMQQRSQRRPSLSGAPDIMSADIFTKPFNFVGGGVSKRR